jgi:hypothetical protein
MKKVMDVGVVVAYFKGTGVILPAWKGRRK